MSISRFASTQARTEVQCPHCGAPPGEYCVMPKAGTRARMTHTQRVTVYRDSIGLAEFKRRHSILPQAPIIEDVSESEINVLCPHCRKPIVKTSTEFGMDCEDDCARREYQKAFPGTSPAKQIEEEVKQIMKQFGMTDD